MRGGAREGTGGAMPGAGRKPNAIPTKPHLVRLTVDQGKMMKALGGSPWLQGLLNIIEREAAAGKATVMIVIVPKASE